MSELFKIFSVKEEDVKKITASPDEPHQDDFEELIIGIEGIIEHFIDFQSESINTLCGSFVTENVKNTINCQKKDN